jgi:nucleotide-binding universal stress UspA family protein
MALEQTDPSPYGGEQMTRRRPVKHALGRIVVGVDGSRGSAAALEWALRQAELTQSTVTAVLAYSYDLWWIDGGTDYESEQIERKALEARRMVAAMLAETVPESTSVVVHPLVVEGHPTDVLLEVAREADLLVVGSRGRRELAGLLLGSVSQRCAERAPCPVVVVPDPSRGDPDRRR